MNRVRLIGGLVLTALLLGACAADSSEATGADHVVFDFDGVAATVNGVEIPAAGLRRQIEVLRGEPGWSEVAFNLVDVDQSDSDQPSPVVVASLLTTDIGIAVVEAELEARALEVSDRSRLAARTQLVGTYGSVFDELPDPFRLDFIEWNAVIVELDRDLGASQDVSEWIREALATAEVTVDPQYGMWNAATISVDPVAGAAAVIEFEVGE